MKRSKALVGLVSIMALLSVGMSTGMGAEVTLDKNKPLIQMAILLDTSGSMDGLIDQAKAQLWKIVNELVSARKNGQRPELQVALYEYGKSSIPADEGYIRMITPLTTDLDRVSEELYALRTNGGDEYCGQAIAAATRGLQWSNDPRDLKLIFIAGNEPFTQGQVDYREAARQAIARGIQVNTIHCGSYEEGVQGNWKDGALLADGSYMNIDQNRKVPQITAPQDAEIARLNGELNATYIAYGAGGATRQMRQEAQDTNAGSSAPASMSQRAKFKASASYTNAEWDLVDAAKDGNVKIEDLEEAALPEEMKKMSTAERKAHVEENGKKRAEIQKQILKLTEERDAYVVQARKQMSSAPDDTLDEAMIKSLRVQAVNKAYQFE